MRKGAEPSFRTTGVYSKPRGRPRPGRRTEDSSNNRALSHWWISAGRSYLRGATGRIHLELGATITFQIIARLAVAALRSDPDPGVREAAKKTLSLVQ